MNRLVWKLACASLLASAALHAAPPPSDPRFFGTYCGSAEVEHCVKVKIKFLGFVIDERTECQTIELDDIKVELTHTDTEKGAVIGGKGTAKVDSDPIGFVVAGAVIGQGFARGSATVAGLDPYFSAATLSSDGLKLSVFAYGERVDVRKDACGNGPPQVSIVDPSDGETLVFGALDRFRGQVTDPDDSTFPEERQSFVSDRDGQLTGFSGATDTSLTVYTNALSPGAHVITYSATDSGGLTASASIDVTVQNDPPDPPIILQPQTGDTLVATGEVLLEGKAFDREEGMLGDDALAWSVQQLGLPLILGVGTGQRVTTSFANPGSYVIRLTATDEIGAQTFTERTVPVQPFTGNTPPRVTINIPDHLQTPGEIAAAVVAGDIQFVGTVADTEDLPSDLELKWTAQAVDPPGPEDDFATGTTTATANLAPGVSTFYRVTFSATDSGGLNARTSIKILVMPTPIL